MSDTQQEITRLSFPTLPAVVCQVLGLAAAGALLGIAPQAGRLMSDEGKGWAFVIPCVTVCASFVLKGVAAHVARASPVSAMVCTFWAGGALLAMSTMSLIVPPVEYRSQITVVMVLGLILLVFPFANLLEERKKRSGQ
jgi:hypothetical protein